MFNLLLLEEIVHCNVQNNWPSNKIQQYYNNIILKASEIIFIAIGI